MKRSSLVSIALLACAALASVAVATYERVAIVASAFYRGIKDFVLGGIALVAGSSHDLNPVSIRIQQAKAFVQRIARRERVVLTSS